MTAATGVTLEDIQQKLQDTGGVPSDDEDADTRQVDPLQQEICSGEKGCGQSFHVDEVGADFRFSHLCAACFKRGSESSSSSSITVNPLPSGK
jgi:hypothetical protein